MNLSSVAPDAGIQWKLRARRAALWSGLAAFAMLAIAIAIARSWRGELPTQIPVHWGLDGTPNRFASLTSYLSAFAIIAIPTIGLYSMLCLFLGRAAIIRRVFVWLTIWMGAFLAIFVLGPISSIRDTAATGMHLPDSVLIAASVIPIIPATIATLLVSSDPKLPREVNGITTPESMRVNLGQSERAVWTRRISGGGALVIVFLAAVILVIVAIVTRAWWPIPLIVFFGSLIPALASAKLRVDQTGLTVRSGLGWPRLHVSAAEVRRASVVNINPWADFGGYGWRVGAFGKGYGRTGVITRSGEALLVEYTGNRGLIVTTDDAATGAALLNTLADRS